MVLGRLNPRQEAAPVTKENIGQVETLRLGPVNQQLRQAISAIAFEGFLGARIENQGVPERTTETGPVQASSKLDQEGER